MSNLEVPGSKLYYETEGSGPLLVLVPGGNGDGEVFKSFAEQLKPHYTVLRYDRRGFSRSELTAPQDYSVRLETDAEDVKRLIESQNGAPATVFGTSSGAIVTLELLVLFPEVVKTAITHEPPLLRLLPDWEDQRNFYAHLFGVYRTEGAAAAMREFAEKTVDGPEKQMMQRAAPEGKPSKNRIYWFEHELREYPTTRFDMETLKRLSPKLIVTGGRDSVGQMPYIVASNLTEALGKPLLPVPGGHLGYLLHSEEFATALRDGLAQA